MKNIRSFLVLFFIGIIITNIFIACNKDEPEKLEPNYTDFVHMSYDEVLQKSAIRDESVVEELDYMIRHGIVCQDKFNELHTTGIIGFYKYYGEDDYTYPFLSCGTNDLIYTRDGIRNLLNDEKANIQSGVVDDRKHRRYTYMYTSAGGTITVRQHLNLPQSWKDATAEACSAWTALGYKVKFSGYCSANNNFLSNEIDVAWGTIPGAQGGVIAATEYIASANRFSEKIIINQNYTGQSLSPSAKKLAMVHELGHAIGLLHTDTNEGIQVPNVPCAQSGQYDPASVMFPSINPNASWLGFTYCDKQVTDYYW